MRTNRIEIVAILFLALSPATVATAENWIAGSGNWNTPGNWSPATVPSGGDLVTITPADGAARTITYDYTGAPVTLNELRVDLTGAGSAATTLSMSANNLTSTFELVGYNGRGTFNHSGGTNTIAAGGYLDVGAFPGSTGTYNLSGSGALVANTSEYIGDISTGFFNQTGGSNTINGFDHHLFLGYNVNGTNGTYTLSNGSLSVNSGDEYIGYNRPGTFIQSGGTNTISGGGRNLYIGYNAGGIYTLSAGNLSADNDTFVGRSTGGTGRLDITNGGTMICNNNGVIINNGSATVSGPGSSLTGRIYVGEYGTGTLEITDGGSVTSASGNIGVGGGSTGSVTVSGAGSTWTPSYIVLGDLGGAGTLTVRDQGLVYVETALLIYSGAIINLQGGTLRFDQYDRVAGAGTFNFFAGTIQLAGNRIIGTDVAITELFGAAPTIPTGKGLTVEGTATFNEAVAVDGGVLTVGGLASATELQLQRGTFNVTNQALTIGASGPLGSALDVNEDVTVNVTLGITNQGLVTGDGQIGGTFANAAAGELRAEPGRSLKLTGANNTNAGQISLYGGMLEFTQNLTNNAGAFISGNGTLKTTTGLVNNGTMNFSGLANVVGDVTNSATGKVISSGGGPTTFLDDVTNQGEIRTSAGSFTVFFGAVTGAGTFVGLGTVNFEGDLKPGNSAAAVNFAGDVVLGPAATLEIELGGTTAGSQYDQINVAGKLSLGGTLEISLINGFTPSAGQTFDILNWGSLAGAFSSFILPSLEGLAWDTSQLSNGMLSVVPGLPGDYNDDGVVDTADYVMWRKLNGTSTVMPNDPNPLPIDGDQYVTWRGNFGESGGAGGASGLDGAVPEPGGLLMVAVAMMMAVGRWGLLGVGRL